MFSKWFPQFPRPDTQFYHTLYEEKKKEVDSAETLWASVKIGLSKNGWIAFLLCSSRIMKSVSQLAPRRAYVWKELPKGAVLKLKVIALKQQNPAELMQSLLSFGILAVLQRPSSGRNEAYIFQKGFQCYWKQLLAVKSMGVAYSKTLEYLGCSPIW